jgi:hypothetical protein
MRGERHYFRADAAAVLDREIDELLLQLRGLALVRELLVERGASRGEVAEHTRELARVRTRLAGLLSGPADVDIEDAA